MKTKILLNKKKTHLLKIFIFRIHRAIFVQESYYLMIEHKIDVSRNFDSELHSMWSKIQQCTENDFSTSV